MLLVKDSSWNTAMAVYHCFELIHGDGSPPAGMPPAPEHQYSVVAQLANFNGQSAIRISAAVPGRHAWVMKARISDRISITFACDAKGQTDFDRTVMPNDKAWRIELKHDKHYEAAELLHDFITTTELDRWCDVVSARYFPGPY